MNLSRPYSNAQLTEQIDILVKESLDMKRVLLKLFTKAYDFDEDKGFLIGIKDSGEADKTEEENKRAEEKNNTIINYVNRIRKELE